MWLTVFSFVLFIGFAFTLRDGWFFANLAFSLPLLLGSAALHELGHACVAKWVGLDVLQVRLGAGPVKLATQALGFQWEIRKYPVGGAVRAVGRDDHLRILRALAFVLAGPATNLAIAAAGVAVLAYTSYVENAFSAPAPLTTLVFANTLLGVANLLPFRSGGGLDSDGKLILVTLLVPAARREQLREAYYVFKVIDLLAHERVPESIEIAREAIGRVPERASAWMTVGISCLEAQRFGEARAAFEYALAYASADAAIAVHRSNLAYSLLAVGEEAGLARGAALSEQAWDVLPWLAPVAHTRACYLILADRPAEAVDVIEQMLGDELLPRHRKEVLHTLAVACECAGDARRARELRAEAERIEGEVLRSVERIRAERAAGASRERLRAF